MKIILIRPPSRLGVLASKTMYEPLNLELIAAYLKQQGYPDVEIWDYKVDRFSEQGFLERIRNVVPTLVIFAAVTVERGWGKLLRTKVEKLLN